MTDEQRIERWAFYQVVAEDVERLVAMARERGDSPELVASLEAALREAIVAAGKMPRAAVKV